MAGMLLKESLEGHLKMTNSDNESSLVLDFLGICTLNITNAAILVAKSLYCEGEIELAGDKDYNSYLHSKELEKDLEKHIEKFAKILTLAINAGTLKSTKILRNLDESIVSEETCIDESALISWLEERNIHLGDFYYEDYLSFERDLAGDAADYIKKERLKRSDPEEYKKYKEATPKDQFYWYTRYSELEKEKHDNAPAPKEKPIHTKERDSLLKLFIGMAVANYGLDTVISGELKASEICSDILLQTGISIDEDTVRKYLKKSRLLLPELETELV